MNPEALRARLLNRIDSLLGRWVLGAQDRALLTGLRGYVGTMTADELNKLGAFTPETRGATSVSLYPYPASVPTGEVLDLVLAALRGGSPDPKQAAHAAWHLAGYGLSLWDAHPPLGAEGHRDLSDAEAADELAKLRDCEAAGGVHAIAIPWALLIPVLLELARRLFAK